MSLLGLHCLVFLNLPFASSIYKCFLGPHEKSTKYNLPMPTTNQSSEHHLFRLYRMAFGWLSDSPLHCMWCCDFCLDSLRSKYVELFTFWMTLSVCISYTFLRFSEVSILTCRSNVCFKHHRAFATWTTWMDHSSLIPQLQQLLTPHAPYFICPHSWSTLNVSLSVSILSSAAK